MKKMLLGVLFAGVLYLNSSVYAVENNLNLVKVLVNGKILKTDVDPRIVNNRTIVPLRGIFEELGAKVVWNQAENSVTIKYAGSDDLIIDLNRNIAKTNENTIELDVAPFIDEGRVMIPLRIISETIGMNVNWISESNVATITEKDFYNTLPKDIIMGFAVSYYQGDNLSYNSLKKNDKSVNLVSVFNYSFDNSGNLKLMDQYQGDLVKYAIDNDIKPLAVIHNINGGSFDRDLVHSLLIDNKKKENLINEIVVMLGKEGYSGVNIDFEDIHYNDRELFSTFMQELKNTLSKYGYLTTVSVPAKTQDNAKVVWNGAFDYQKLGKIADYIMLMTYDEHYAASNAGAISSLTWVTNVLNYATKTIPTNKLILGLPLYGYDWSYNKGQAVSCKAIQSLASNNNAQIIWDDASSSPYFTYQKNGVYHEVWFENNESIKLKIELVKKYGLGGVGLWRLGFENDDIWNIIK